MTNDFWAEDLPTFSFTSLNPSLEPDPGKGRHNFEKQKAVKQQTTDVLPCPSMLPCSSPQQECLPLPQAALHWAVGRQSASPGGLTWGRGRGNAGDVGAFKSFKCSKQDRSIRLELGKNQETRHTLRLWPARRNIWWRKKLSGDQNKMEQDQALGGSWPEGGIQQGEISAVSAFTVLLKWLNLRLKGKHVGWLLDWLNKNVKVGSFWELEWK